MDAEMDSAIEDLRQALHDGLNKDECLERLTTIELRAEDIIDNWERTQDEVAGLLKMPSVTPLIEALVDFAKWQQTRYDRDEETQRVVGVQLWSVLQEHVRTHGQKLETPPAAFFAAGSSRS